MPTEIRRLNIIKLLILLQLIYRFKVRLIEIPVISLFLLVIVTKNEIIQRLDRRHRIHLNVVLNLKRKNDKILKLYGRTQSTLKILYDNS